MPISHEQFAAMLAANPHLRINRDSSPFSNQKARSATTVRPESESPATPQARVQAVSFTVLGSPVPKPRQTKRDKWAKRPCVMRYRTWADEAREVQRKAKQNAFPNVRFLGTIRHGRIKAIAFFQMPGSWNSTTKAKMRGQPHCLRPDADNLLKAIADALYPTGDEHLYDLQITKRWDDGNGARTVITLW